MRKAPNKDRVKVGIDFLTRARVFEESRTPAQPVPALQDVDSDEQERRGIQEIIEAFAEIAIETHRIFGLEMPELEPAKERVRLGGSKVLANGSLGPLTDTHMTKPSGTAPIEGVTPTFCGESLQLTEVTLCLDSRTNSSSIISGRRGLRAIAMQRLVFVDDDKSEL
jgi:hypothetical protein